MKINTLKNLGLCAVIPSIMALSACGGSESSAPSNSSTSAPQSAPQSAPKATPAAAADPMARGAKLFKRCQACHSLEEGGRHKVGPNLWAVYGSKPGIKEDFKYSDAMIAMDIVWNDETLSGYLENPRKYLPGGKMAYAGLRKAEDRAALLTYIKAETTP